MLFLFLLFPILFPGIAGHATQIFPNVTNKEMILSLAELAANAYHDPSERNTSSWRNETLLWNYLDSYGWEVDGLRGHVFSHTTESILTISVKGTSLNSAKDKESANLICSCNCCYSNCTNACDKERLLHSLPNMYLSLLLIAYYDLKQDYPFHSIWFTGHSMGAVIAALGGVRTCNPAIGFSAPGEQLFADRIDLKHECDNERNNGEGLPPIYHIGYYRDPIFVGNCGWLCSLAGYRMDSKCHHGMECVYKDSTEDDEPGELDEYGMGGMIGMEDVKEGTLGSGLIYTHTANFLIDKVIKPADAIPLCYPSVNCTEKCKDEKNILI